MSATNSTTNYNLPIFIASDSPKWLVDWNGAMNTIDSAINTVATAASGAAGDITTLQSDLQTLSGTVTTQGTSISTLTSSLSSLTGTVNTITSLIGNGVPTTTDKTIIGAINELHSDIQQIVVSVDADDVSYDNTSSGLLATNVQAAIDELATATPTTASRRIISIADSYSTKSDGRPGYNDNLASIFGLTGSAFYSLAEGTLGFIRKGSSGHTALTLLQDNAALITDHDTITDIIVTVGINDAIDDANITAMPTAIATFVTYCNTNYPNAKIHYGFVGNIASTNVNTLEVLNNFWTLVPIIYSAFESNKCDVMHGLEYVMHDARNLLSTDWVHPNERGCQEIAKFIFAWITEGFCKYKTHVKYVTTNNDIVYATIDGEMTYVEVRKINNQSFTPTGPTTDLITFDLTKFPIRGNSIEKQYGLIPIVTASTPSNTSQINYISIFDGKLVLLNVKGVAITTISSGFFVFNTLMI